MENIQGVGAISFLDNGYSLDNRRLYAFQQAGIESVPVQIINNTDTILGEAWKFSTNTWGLYVRLV